MTKDLFYVFDKNTLFRTELGEIQTDFNMSFVIDGTKDSCAITVFSYIDYEIEPYTICWHAKTNSWWVVSRDKVERYQNENGFLYIHNLDLLGAQEILNARDLTDCGFNSNTYTVESFIKRLFSLSNFELPILFDSNIAYNFRVKNVDFIKTYENYTLLSALREFLDAYNSCLKLTFDTTIVNDQTKLYYARIHILQKTGNLFLESHDINDFDNVRETKTISKESFGTCVVSNAENVISSKDKTFPSVGGVLASSNEYQITADNGLIRLPSKVFKANWLKIITQKAPLRLTVNYNGSEVLTQEPIFCNAYSYASVQKAFEKIKDLLLQRTSQSFCDEFEAAFEESKERVVEDLRKASAITLYNGNVFNPITAEIEQGPGVPYLVYANFHSKEPLSLTQRPFIFCDKSMKETLSRPWQGIQWERGSNIISGFDGFQAISGSQNTIKVDLKYTDLQQETNEYIYFRYNGQGSNNVILKTLYVPNGSNVNFHFGANQTEQSVAFIVNYIPMADIKVKVDNDRDKRDVQLYNQNGKLTDSVAFSKLINSYALEISSDNIVRYMQYYDFNSVPKVGSFVNVNNVEYVINNISLTFSQNESNNTEDFGYYIDCEFNMSKAVSTKSLLVNPNTNIRDYGIPQNYNIKRKQLYRDYYELDYETFSDSDQDSYLPMERIFNFAHNLQGYDNFVAVIDIEYSEMVENSYHWYFQLETTNYYLDKMLYVVLDFNDNNIIGYGSQNVFSGFDISRIFSGLTENLNTPISYVDTNGKLKGINILLCTNEQITTVYDNYQQSQQGGSSWEGTLYNYSALIPSDIYINCADDNYEIAISEPNYKKDALEVPVFEYVCQINDSKNVLIGNNILPNIKENTICFYSYVKGQNLTPNNVFQSETINASVSPIGWRINNGATIEYERYSNTTRLLRINIFATQLYDINENTWRNRNQTTFEEGYDYAFFRNTLNLRTQEQECDLLFIAKKVPYSHISQDSNELTLEINHYKLK